mgnify:CR=1 FL=1
MHIVIHTDGGSRGNPGPAASAFTVHTPQNELIHEESLFLGDTTNNVAEYTALRMACEWAVSQKDLGITTCDILMDSELVVKQMRGEYKIKDQTLLSIATEIKRILKTAPFSVSFVHVRRAENAHADQLVNAVMDRNIGH